jgi:hypothetical protein
MNLILKAVLSLSLGIAAIHAAHANQPPTSLKDYTWLTISKDRLTIPAANYRRGSVDAAIKDLEGLFKLFQPQPKHDPTLKVRGHTYDPRTQMLEIHITKKKGFIPIRASSKLRIETEAYDGCGAGKGYTLRMDTGDENYAREVHLRICSNEAADGSLTMDTELAVVVGKSYEQWVFWTSQDMYSSMPSALLKHVKNKSVAIPSATNYGQMFHKLTTQLPTELFPHTDAVPAAHEDDDSEDTFLN